MFSILSQLPSYSDTNKLNTIPPNPTQWSLRLVVSMAEGIKQHVDLLGRAYAGTATSEAYWYFILRPSELSNVRPTNQSI